MLRRSASRNDTRKEARKDGGEQMGLLRPPRIVAGSQGQGGKVIASEHSERGNLIIHFLMLPKKAQSLEE